MFLVLNINIYLTLNQQIECRKVILTFKKIRETRNNRNSLHKSLLVIQLS